MYCFHILLLFIYPGHQSVFPCNWKAAFAHWSLLFIFDFFSACCLVSLLLLGTIIHEHLRNPMILSLEDSPPSFFPPAFMCPLQELSLSCSAGRNTAFHWRLGLQRRLQGFSDAWVTATCPSPRTPRSPGHYLACGLAGGFSLSTWLGEVDCGLADQRFHIRVWLSA